MAVRNTVVVVTSNPERVGGSDADGFPYRRDLAILNTGAVTVYLGGPTVASTDGYPLASGEGVSFDGVTPDSLPFLAVAAEAGEVRVLEVGV